MRNMSDTNTENPNTTSEALIPTMSDGTTSTSGVLFSITEAAPRFTTCNVNQISKGKGRAMSNIVEINNTGKGSRDISFDKGKQVPNRDFVLSYSLKNKDHPNTALFTSKMGDDNYFMLMTVPPAKGTKKVMPKEVIYILDISGSMGGTSILQAKKALYQAIYNLNEGFGNKGDYFNIIVFNILINHIFKIMAGPNRNC